MFGKILSALVYVVAALAVIIGVCWGLSALLDYIITISWAQQHLGYVNNGGNSPHYLFYSGFGSIILPPVITVGGFALLWGWHNQCHMDGCFWPTRHVTASNEKVCFIHYPKITGRTEHTVQSMRERHHLYLGEKMGKG